MANRYWVGGSGTWDPSTTTNWAATSGGAGGASAPTSADAAIFDANSGSPDVYCLGAVCLSLTHSAGNAIFSGNSLSVYGALTFSAGTTVNTISSLDFVASSGSHAINFAGKDLNLSSISFGFPSPGASTATWTLGSAVVNANNFSIYSGTFTSGNNAIDTDNFYVNGGFGAVTINLGSSVLGTAPNPIGFIANNTNQSTLMTLNLATSTIHAYIVNLYGSIISGTQYLTVTSSAGQSFQGGVGSSSFFNCVYVGSNVALKNITNYPSVAIGSQLGTVAVGAISYDGTGGLYSTYVDINSLASETGTVSATSVVLTNPASSGNRLKVYYGNFTCSGAVTLPLSTLYFEGSALTISGATSVATIDCSNSGTASFAAISPPSGEIGDYEFYGSGNVTTGAITTTNLSHGGAGNLTVGIVTSSSASSSATFSSYNGPTGNFVATSFLVGASASRWNIFAHCAAFTCGAINAYSAAIETSSGTISITGAVTLADDAFGTAQGMFLESATTGTLNSTFTTPSTDPYGLVINGGTITVFGAISTSAIVVNSGGLTASGASTTASSSITSNGALSLAATVSTPDLFCYAGSLVLNASSTTLTNSLQLQDGVTVTGGTSTLTFSPASGVRFYFQHGGATYNNIVANGDYHLFQGLSLPTFTCNNFTRTGSAILSATLQLSATNITCNGTFSLAGNSLTNRLFVFNVQDGAQCTITAATRNLSSVDLRNINAAGGVLPWGAGSSVGDAQNNSNITFTPAVTRYATASGAWDSTSVWSASAGGVTGASVPLPQDTVQFTSASPTVNVTTGTRRFLCQDLIVSNYTGTITVNTSTATSGVSTICNVLGDVSIQSGATLVSDGLSYLRFMKSGSASFALDDDFSAPLISACTTNLNLNIGNNALNGLVVNGGTTTLTSSGGTVNNLLSSITQTTADSYNSPTPTGPLTLDLSGTNTLITNSVNIASAIINAGTSKLVYVPSLAPLQLIGIGSGTSGFYDVEIANSTSSFPEIQISFRFLNKFTSSSSTAPFRIFGFLYLYTNSQLSLGTYLAPVLTSRNSATSTANGGLIISNLSSLQQETEYVYYRYTQVTGGPAIKAFGATNVGGNVNVTFPSLLKTAVFTSSGSWSIPNDFGGTFQAFAYGGGGQAAVRSSGLGASGGAGGGGLGIAYGIPNIKRGQTIYTSVSSATSKRTTAGSGANGGDTWVNFTANSFPATNNLGSAGRGGLGSSSSSNSGGGGGGTGFAMPNVGVLTVNGGSGGSGGSSPSLAGAGGGGAAALTSYGSLPSTARTGGIGSNSGGAGGGAGTTGNGGNGTSNGGIGGSPNPGTAGTTLVDGGNGGEGGGGGGGGSTRSGGNGGNATTWTYNYLNGSAASGSIGIGGAGGGSGSQSGSTRVIGGDGGISAGGGGAGRYSSATVPYGGAGGAGLVVFVYAVGIEETSSQIIG